MVGRGFVVDGRFAPDDVLAVLARPRTLRVLWFTVWSAGLATLVCVLAGVPLAWALHRLSFPGRRLLRGLVLVPFVLPTVVVGVAFGQLLAPAGWLGFLHLQGTAVAIVLALAFFNVSVVVRTVGSFWEDLDVRREEAAAALGATPWQVLRTVTLPTLLPGVVGAATVVFLFCSTSFGVVLTMGGLRYANVETEIYLLTTQELDLRGAAALSVLQLLVLTALLALAHLTGRAVPVDRVRARPRRPRRGDLLALGWSALVVAALLLPMLALVVRSLATAGGGWTLEHYRALGHVSAALPASALTGLSNSAQIALVATALSMLLGVAVAGLVTRPGGGRWRSVLDGAFMLPLGVSAVTLGFGFLVTLDHPPLDLRASPWLVPIAQAMVALPLVVRTVAPVLRAVDDRQRQAAASLGAGPLRVLLTVDLAVAWRPLLAAAGFAFAVSLGEFGATSFVVRETTPTLPVLIYRLISRPDAGDVGTALAASVVLAVATALVMLCVERVRP
ncbi:iron ABC transporter permease [Nocardioides mangrovicus]|uniref:Iron ABC transporter permease n=2 Tax=Nocardioides mangrovicus TaxID=2478913 RepID=A0A3L8P7P9_9ACTN|nr:iron ABC transporter permease [Nocardioides mangrovicus]